MIRFITVKTVNGVEYLTGQTRSFDPITEQALVSEGSAVTATPAEVVPLGSVKKVMDPATGIVGLDAESAAAIAGAGFTKGAAGQASLRQVATNASLCSAFAGSNRQIFGITPHDARVEITSLVVGYAAWYVKNTNGVSDENNIGSPTTFTAAIEYPRGTYTRVTFNGGAAFGVAPDGATLLSDPVAIKIPKGARFWMRQWASNASGVVYNAVGANIVKRGDICTVGVTTPDLTMGGAIGSTNVGSVFGPALILGVSSAPAVVGVGDSRGYGLRDLDADNTTARGNWSRYLGSLCAFSNFCFGGARADAWALGNAKRLSLLKYFTHAVMTYGTNDVIAAQNAATVTASLTGVAASLSPLHVIGLTVGPLSSSTDSWATVGNQTTAATNAVRTAVNDGIRTGIAGVASIVDIADVQESARNSGLWKAGGTTDGTHEETSMNLAIRDARIWPAIA